MKTACTGPSTPATCEVLLEGVDLAAEGVAAHRDVEPAEGLLAGDPALDGRSASRIIPAQVPNAGMPAAIRSRSGSNSSKVRASLAIVVDSPPGQHERVDGVRARPDGVRRSP